MKWGRAACFLALAALAGCSLTGKDEPPPAKGAAREVAGVVARLQRAVARGDWRAICDDILTPAARRREGGRDCPRLLRSDAGGVRRPRIEVLTIELKAGRASVQVRSRARGQPALTDVIEMRRAGDTYRIESLK